MTDYRERVIKEAVAGYLAGRYEVDELELRIDLRLLPGRVAHLVDIGYYERQQVRTIVLREMVDPSYLILMVNREGWDGSVHVAGQRI